MYNPEMKEGFIESYLRSRIIQKTSLYGLFHKIESYEENIGKDVSEFTKEDSLDVMKSLATLGIESDRNLRWYLRIWCS